MLYATNIFPGDGTTRQFELTFVGGYLDRDHVIAYYEDNLSKVQTPIDIGTVTWLGPYTVQLPPGAAASPGTNVVFARQTPREPLVDFQGSSRITEANLDLAHRQGLFVAVESLDSSNSEVVNQLKDVIIGVQEVADAALLSAAASEASAAEAASSALIVFGEAAQAMSSATAAQAQAVIASNHAADTLTYRNAAEGFKNTAVASASAAGVSEANALAYRNTASGHASAALGSANAASSSAAAALASQNAAAGSATAASNSAGAAATSASNANTSAGNAAYEVTLATAQKVLAVNAASDANTSKVAAAASADAALTSAQGTLHQCGRIVRGGGTRQVKLERFGGNSLRIANVAVPIPSGGVTLTLNHSGTVAHIYAYLTAGSAALIENGTVPTWDAGTGAWTYPGIPAYLYMGSAVPNDMAQAGKFRSMYNGGGVTVLNTPTTDLNGNWDGSNTVVSTITYLELPGDLVTIEAHTAWLNMAAGVRVADVLLYEAGTLMSRSRNTLLQGHWTTGASKFVQTFPDTLAPYYSWSDLRFLAIDGSGGAWTVNRDLLRHRATIVPLR